MMLNLKILSDELENFSVNNTISSLGHKTISKDN